MIWYSREPRELKFLCNLYSCTVDSFRDYQQKELFFIDIRLPVPLIDILAVNSEH
jgi:hypothetical protein